MVYRTPCNSQKHNARNPASEEGFWIQEFLSFFSVAIQHTFFIFFELQCPPDLSINAPQKTTLCKSKTTCRAMHSLQRKLFARPLRSAVHREKNRLHLDINHRFIAEQEGGLFAPFLSAAPQCSVPFSFPLFFSLHRPGEEEEEETGGEKVKKGPSPGFFKRG